MQRQCQNLYYAQYFRPCCVVGYASIDTIGNGAKGLGINFVNVSGGATKLGDLKVVGYTFEGEFEGSVTAQILDDKGLVAKNEDGLMLAYEWADWEEEGERFTGWFLDGEPADETPLSIGDGLWVQSDSDSLKIQCAGQVYGEPLPVNLIGGGAKMCANPVPASIKYSTIVITGYEESFDEEFEGSVTAQVLDDKGMVATNEDGLMLAYEWADWEEEGERFTGWFLDGEPADDAVLGLGEALWIQSSSSDYSIVFPTAL